MTESELRDVLLLRALEREASALAPSDPLALGLAADLAWAGTEARRRPQPPTGVSAAAGDAALPAGAADDLSARAAAASGQAWLALRARLGLLRLRERWGSAMPVGLDRAAAGLGSGWAWALPASALLLGGVGDVLAGSREVNLLALPLLGLLAWNGAVYAVLAVHGLLALARSGRAGPVADSSAGPLRRAALRLLWQPGTPAHAGPVPASAAARPAVAGSFAQWSRVQAAFAQDWLAVSGPLQAARLAMLVHAAAACLALGLVAALYTRGLVLDYRAGWDSTFLDAAGVRRLLGLLLGPASALSGLPLPDVPSLTGLRLARGGGEGAARWIHLWALTLGLMVILPRAALAGLAGVRAWRIARRLPLPPDSDDLQRLMVAASGAPLQVWALPYSYQLDNARQAVLATLVGRRLGPQAQLQTQPSLPQGAEDHLPAGLPEGTPAQVLLLLALTATPQRESHGAVVSALQAWLAGRCPVQVWVDESGWRERLPGPAGAERLQQRRQAWVRLLAAFGQVPVFVDLSPGGRA